MNAQCSYYPEVIQALPGEGKNVYAYFSDGSIRQFDMAPEIAKGGVFSALEDDAFFRNAITVLNGTVAWDLSGRFDPTDCIDIDPFVLYEGPSVPDPLDPVA